MIPVALFYFCRNETPGPPSSRNSTPAFSNVTIRRVRDSVLARTGPSSPSILRTVPSATFDFFESSYCVHPSIALAARICLPVMMINANK